MRERRLIDRRVPAVIGYIGVMTAPDSPESRNRESVFLLAEVVGVGEGGPAQRHRVRNVSEQGACIEGYEGLVAGARLIVSIGMVERIHAEVKWVRGGLAGLRFAQPIDVAQARKRPPKSLDPREGWGRMNAL